MKEEESHPKGSDETQESKSERAKRIKRLSLSIFDLLDPQKPWVLVENGSILGLFDWVPETLRIGPWSPLAPAVLFSMVYMATFGIILAYRSIRFETDPTSYPPFFTTWWYYNLFGFLWISWISVRIWFGRVGPYAWATFTMWSWTLLQIRHFLSVLAPWLQPESTGIKLLELLHYPMLMMHSMTFTVWNFILMPVVYFFFMKTEASRKQFLSYYTSFNLTQLHVFNIIFAYLNGVCASPSRNLALSDFMTAFGITVIYALWYTLVLDRIGVHTYPIFSPRSPWMIVMWSLLILSQWVCFQIWKQVLR